MEVILREDIERVGNRGQVVRVADGYAIFYRPNARRADAKRKIVEQERQGASGLHDRAHPHAADGHIGGDCGGGAFPGKSGCGVRDGAVLRRQRRAGYVLTCLMRYRQ
jgi:hypothetical protein